jgi:hypothetical protein
MDLLAGRSRWGGRFGLCDTTLDQLIHETLPARRLASGALIARLLVVSGKFFYGTDVEGGERSRAGTGLNRSPRQR